MPEAVIVSAARTGIRKTGGGSRNATLFEVNAD